MGRAEDLEAARRKFGFTTTTPTPEPEPPKPPPPVKPRPAAPTPPAPQYQRRIETPASDILRRVPPQNLEAEESVLGAILLDNEALVTATEVLAENDFYRESHRNIFASMVALGEQKQPIDAITLTNILRSRLVLEQVGGAAYIAELAMRVPTSANIKHYAQIVREMSGKRQAAMIFTGLASDAYNGVSLPALIGEAERQLKPLFDADIGGESSTLPAPQTADEWYMEETKRFEGTTFIWDGILEAGGLSIITGKKAHGKSTFARWLALSISRGMPVLGRDTVQTRTWYIDLEPGGAGRIEVFKRLGWSNDDWLEINTIPPIAGNPDAFKWMKRFIQRRGFGLVILDTLFKAVKIDGSNDYDKGVYAQVPIEQLARETGAHFLLLHHARKNNVSEGTSVAEAVLGATSLAGAACACMLVTRRGESFTFRMDPPRYGTAIEGELVISKDTEGRIEATGSWKGKWAAGVKKVVLAAMQAQGRDWIEPKELEAVNDAITNEKVRLSSVKWACKVLAQDGELEERNKETKGKGRPPKEYRIMPVASIIQLNPADRIRDFFK